MCATKRTYPEYDNIFPERQALNIFFCVLLTFKYDKEYTDPK